MPEDVFKNYIHDLGILLKENAIQAKIDKNSSVEKDTLNFNLGYLMAYHEIISLMKQQADVFCIREEDIGLNGIDPESDLL